MSILMSLFLFFLLKLHCFCVCISLYIIEFCYSIKYMGNKLGSSTIGKYGKTAFTIEFLTGANNLETLVRHYQNLLVPLRMEFFRYISNITQTFLGEFQTDKPMLAFLSSTLEKEMRKLCQTMLKGSIINEATCWHRLTSKRRKISFPLTVLN